jgi:hypothetical protein
MIDLKKYIAESHEPTAMLPAVDHDPNEVNDVLFHVLSHSIITAEAGFERIRRVLEHYGIPFAPNMFHDPEFGEETYEVGENQYIYINYELSENGYYEFYAELTDRLGLDAIMSIGENEEESE